MKDNWKEHLISSSSLYLLDTHPDSIDWKNKTQWIDSELKLQEECTEEEYWKQQDSIREIMELNMVLYGRW